VHWLHEQLVNFNMISFILICIFVVTLSKSSMRKELTKISTEFEQYHQTLMTELDKIEQDVKYILGKMER
jgi:hypothetical protein